MRVKANTNLRWAADEGGAYEAGEIRRGRVGDVPDVIAVAYLSSGALVLVDEPAQDGGVEEGEEV